jgi:ubiquinone/menaquinone biosynthesis C-methylase UbiE
MKMTTQPWDEHDAVAYQRFLGAARGYWSTRMFDGLRAQIARDVPRDADDAAWARQVREHPTHRCFAFLERHLQRMKYSGPYGLVASVEQKRDALLATLAQPLPEGLLRLDPEMPLPDYYREHDIHQHPGGVAGDALAGVVYRTAAGSGVVGKPQLHDRFAKLATAGRDVTRVLDLGCGFGKSTWAFARALPAAHVDGIDLSPACVTVAAQDTPDELRPRVAFAQADAVTSGLPDASYDLVTSTMLLHEMPEDAVRELIAESARLTKPGGAVVHLDFLPPADPLLAVLFEGHARRNNEPFLLDHSRIDLREAYARAGFRRVEAVAFAEEDGALDPALPRWRLPWAMIVAER